MSEVIHAVATLRRPAGLTDVGHVVEGYYVVDGDVIRLTDCDGKPLTRSGRQGGGARWEQRFPPGTDRDAIARQLLRDKYYAERGSLDFHRPLTPPKMSIV